MFYRRQTLFFCLVTTIMVGPYLLLHGTNIVTQTYKFAATQFFQLASPYVDPKGQGDFFKYSPFFCLLYYPISLLQNNLQAFVWGLMNLSLYWYAVTRWEKLEKGSSKWLWFAFIACSMEADGSLRYQQVNAILIGATLLGIAHYRDQKYFSAGLILSLITNIKLLPLLFLGALLFPVQKKYILGVISGFLIAFLAPAFVRGWQGNLALHWEWVTVVYQDLFTKSLLDLGTILSRYGVDSPRMYFSLPVGIVTAVILMVSRFFPIFFSWNSFVSLGVFATLLLSPRTESPTFVLAGPAYVLLISEVLKTEKATRYSLLFSTLMGIALVTLTMNDLWPRMVINVGPMRYANKTFGVLVLWFTSLSLIFHQVIQRLPRHRTVEA